MQVDNYLLYLENSAKENSEKAKRHLEFEKDCFEFELLGSLCGNEKGIVDQIINTRPLFFAEVKKSLEDENTKQIKITEVEREKLYFLRINKEFKKLKFESCFLIGRHDNVDLKKLTLFLPDVCSFISYTQVNGLPYKGRKKLFSLIKSVELDRKIINPIKKLKGTTQVECIKTMLAGVELDKLSLWEQYIVNQIKGITANMLDLYDFWGLYDNDNLVSLIRIDNEITKLSGMSVRSIGMVYTKSECRHRGHAADLIAFVMTQYDERSIWRYESEENNVHSCNLARNLGFSYEGDTFFYEYESK